MNIKNKYVNIEVVFFQEIIFFFNFFKATKLLNIGLKRV